MSQDEVLDWMVKKGKGEWYTAVDISVYVKLSPGSVLRSLKGLKIRGYVQEKVYGVRCFKYKLR